MDRRAQLRTPRDVASLISASGDLALILERLVFAACQNAMRSIGSVMSIDQKSGYAYVVTGTTRACSRTGWRTAADPAVTKLAEPVRRPSATWAGWEVAINRDGSTDRDIKQLSSTWIESNRAVFADWVAQAGAAK